LIIKQGGKERGTRNETQHVLDVIATPRGKKGVGVALFTSRERKPDGPEPGGDRSALVRDPVRKGGRDILAISLIFHLVNRETFPGREPPFLTLVANGRGKKGVGDPFLATFDVDRKKGQPRLQVKKSSLGQLWRLVSPASMKREKGREKAGRSPVLYEGEKEAGVATAVAMRISGADRKKGGKGKNMPGPTLRTLLLFQLLDRHSAEEKRRER